MKIVLYQGRTPLQVDGFPSDTDRLTDKEGQPRVGAIHFRPGSSVELSDDEYAWIVGNRGDLKKHLVLLKDVKEDS